MYLFIALRLRDIYLRLKNVSVYLSRGNAKRREKETVEIPGIAKSWSQVHLVNWMGRFAQCGGSVGDESFNENEMMCNFNRCTRELSTWYHEKLFRELQLLLKKKGKEKQEKRNADRCSIKFKKI